MKLFLLVFRVFMYAHFFLMHILIYIFSVMSPRITSVIFFSSSSHACCLPLCLYPPSRFSILLARRSTRSDSSFLHTPSLFLNSKPLQNKVCMHVPSRVPPFYISVLPLLQRTSLLSPWKRIIFRQGLGGKCVLVHTKRLLLSPCECVLYHCGCRCHHQVGSQLVYTWS